MPQVGPCSSLGRVHASSSQVGGGHSFVGGSAEERRLCGRKARSTGLEHNRNKPLHWGDERNHVNSRYGIGEHALRLRSTILLPDPGGAEPPGRPRTKKLRGTPRIRRRRPYPCLYQERTPARECPRAWSTENPPTELPTPLSLPSPVTPHHSSLVAIG